MLSTTSSIVLLPHIFAKYETCRLNPFSSSSKLNVRCIKTKSTDSLETLLFGMHSNGTFCLTFLCPHPISLHVNPPPPVLHKPPHFQRSWMGWSLSPISKLELPKLWAKTFPGATCPMEQ